MTHMRWGVGARGHHARAGVTGTTWWYTLLAISHDATSTTRGLEIATRRVIHRAVYVATRDAGSNSLLHAELVALGNLALQLLLSNFTALSERDIEGLRTNHLVVHLCDGLGGLLGTGETNETEALGVVLFVTHDFGTGDGSKRFELCAELFVVDVVIEILDVEVNALILAQLLHLGMLVRLLQFLLTFGFLLRSADVNLVALVLGVVKGLDCGGSIDVVLEVDETKTFAVSLGVQCKDDRAGGSKWGEQNLEFFLSVIRSQVLDVNVGEFFLLLVHLCQAFLVDEPC